MRRPGLLLMRPGFLGAWALAGAGLLAGCAAPPAPLGTPAPAQATAPAAKPWKRAAPQSVNAGDAAVPPPAQDVPPAVAGADTEDLLEGEPTKEMARGGASWYGPRFHGRRTASGERYDQHALTAAHRTLPFGTIVRVRSMVTGREVDVRINDRGPFGGDRIIDVSRAAAEALGMLTLGVKDVLLLLPESVAVPQALPPAEPAPRRALRKPPRGRKAR